MLGSTINGLKIEWKPQATLTKEIIFVGHAASVWAPKVIGMGLRDAEP